MNLFKHFGIDVENQTMGEILNILNTKGIGNFSVVPKDENDNPLGMFLLLADTDAIPYVQKALDEYDAKKEEDEEAVGG